jgi:methyltransferase
MIFFLFIVFVCFLRIGELLLSERNAKWLLERGAVEYGSKHYPFIVALHVCFFISLIIEYTEQQYHSLCLFLLIFYCLLLLFKIWIITTLGKFWNTRIYRIAGLDLIRTGPYKYFKHPNYAVVIAEIAVIPMIFHLYVTAIVFTLLNMIVLFVRIKEENKVLHI